MIIENLYFVFFIISNTIETIFYRLKFQVNLSVIRSNKYGYFDLHKNVHYFPLIRFSDVNLLNRYIIKKWSLFRGQK